ncbi:MAG: MFS transporter [Thermoleophilia bacterium]
MPMRTAPEPPAPLGAASAVHRHRVTLALVVLCGAVFLAALDQTMVVTVLPAIMKTLHIPYTKLDDAAWIVTGYLLGYTVAMPLFGRLADVRGRRLMFVAALVVFALGSVLCVVADGLRWLVAARVIQAAGGGALVPVAMVVAVDLLPGRRAFALGLVGAAAEAGGVLGPLYGATLSQIWGWRAIFLVNVPLSLILMAATYRLVARDTPAQGERRQGIDYVGALLMGAFLASLTIGLAGDTQTGSATVRPAWLAVSAVSLAAFIAFELRSRRPLVQLSLFRSGPFSAANLANFAVGVALIVAMVEVPLYAYSILGSTEIQGGLLLMRLTLMIPLGALAGGWVADRIGYRLTGLLGFALTGVGFILIGFWPAEPSTFEMTSALMTTGLGFGIVIAPIGATVIASVGSAWMTTGSALVTVMRMVGMTVGLSALSSWGLRRFNGLMAGSPLPLKTEGMSQSQYDGLVAAYQRTLDAALHTVYSEFFLIAGGIALAAMVPALFFYRGRERGFRLPFLPQ